MQAKTRGHKEAFHSHFRPIIFFLSLLYLVSFSSVERTFLHLVIQRRINWFGFECVQGKARKWLFKRGNFTLVSNLGNFVLAS